MEERVLFTPWKKEFYSPLSKCSKSKAAAHSLKKWIGLREKNLKKHGLVAESGFLYELDKEQEPNVFEVNGNTCALCKHYYAYVTEHDNSEHPCRKCPLYSILEVSKDHDDVGCSVEYGVFCYDGDPESMIEVLRKAAKLEAKGKSK